LSLSLLHTVRRLLVALANFLNAIAGHRQEAHGVGIFGIKTSEPDSGVRAGNRDDAIKRWLVRQYQSQSKLHVRGTE
jgi:hypothetical protein